MTQITSGVGMFTGLNTSSIITALMSDDQQAYDNLTTKITTDKSEISGYGQIAKSITDLQTAATALGSGNLSTPSATSSDTTTVNATASGTGANTAAAGQYNITVQQLAQDEKIASSPLASTATVFKTGNITINAGGKQTVVNVNANNNTLSGIANAINGSGAGVTATIVNSNASGSSTTASDGTVTSGPRLVITGSGLGTNGNISIIGNDLGPVGQNLSQFNYDSEFGSNTMQVIQQAQNAQFTVDGMQMTSASNTSTTAINGLTLNLSKVTPTGGAPTQVSVTKALPSASAPLQNFVTAYNSTLSTLNGLVAAGQPLANDWTVNDLQRQINDLTTATFGGGTLAQYGFIHGQDGTLSIDTNTMNKSTQNDGGAGLANVVTNMSTTFSKSLSNVLYTVIPNQESDVNTDISNITLKQTSMSEQMQLKKTALTNKFAQLEQTVQNLQQQNSALSSITSSSTSNTAMNSVQTAASSAQVPSSSSSSTDTGSGTTSGTTSGTSGG